MKLYYSATTGEFYDSCVHQTLPDDAVKIGDPNTILATQKYVDDTVQKNRGEIEQTAKEHFAPLNNPVLTGIPTAPTPDAENNSEQLSTTAFVQTLGQRYVTPEQGDTRYWKRSEKLFPDAQSGYQVLPSGLIFQWGMVDLRSSSDDEDTNVIRFPLSFPNEVLSIQLTRNATGLNIKASMMFHYKNIDNTKFFARADWFVDHTTFTKTSWFALGY